MRVLTISIADDIYQSIKEEMIIKNKTNKSEFVEMLIRKGLVLIEKERMKNKVEYNGMSCE